MAKAKAKAKAKTKTKTVWTGKSVSAFIDSIEDERKRADARELLAIFKKATGLTAKMWGPTIVGFGAYHYRYASGHEGDAPATGFSPRASALTLYVMPGNAGPRYRALLEKLGPHKMSKACLYIRRLDDVDANVLGQIIENGLEDLKNMKAPGATFTFREN